MSFSLEESPTMPEIIPHILSSSSESEEFSELNTTPATSNPPSEAGLNDFKLDIFASSTPIESLAPELFSENIMAKVLRTATISIAALPHAFPEIVPQGEGHDGSYTLREADFWTCGFFPGSLYLILERFIRYPQSLNLSPASRLAENSNIAQLRYQLSTLCCSWTEPLHSMAYRTDTHDIGFIIMPALRLDWELDRQHTKS